MGVRPPGVGVGCGESLCLSAVAVRFCLCSSVLVCVRAHTLVRASVRPCVRVRPCVCVRVHRLRIDTYTHSRICTHRMADVALILPSHIPPSPFLPLPLPLPVPPSHPLGHRARLASRGRGAFRGGTASRGKRVLRGRQVCGVQPGHPVQRELRAAWACRARMLQMGCRGCRALRGPRVRMATMASMALREREACPVAWACRVPEVLLGSLAQ